MKTLSRVFWILAVLLSNVMCAAVAYNYCELEWGGRYAGYSASPEAAFWLAGPFLIAIGICVILALFFKQESRLAGR